MQSKLQVLGITMNILVAHVYLYIGSMISILFPSTGNFRMIFGLSNEIPCCYNACSLSYNFFIVACSMNDNGLMTMM